MCVYMTTGQAHKKPNINKASSAGAKPIVLKVPFLKHNFLLDTAIFSSIKVDSGGKSLKLKLRSIKSSSIDIIDGGNSSVTEISEIFKKGYRKYSSRPNKEGYTYENLFTNDNINYNGRSITPIEYKFIYHGSESDRQLAEEMAKMPPLKNPDGTLPISNNDANKFDNDKNNRIFKLYLLNNTASEDNGFLYISYEANYAEDKKYGGSAMLQKLFNVITPLKINDQIAFDKFKNTKFKFDLALPAGTWNKDDEDFRFPLDILGNLKINTVDASGGYTAVFDSYKPSRGNIVTSSTMEQQNLYNGIKGYTRTYTTQNDNVQRYELVNILVPDKLITKTLLFTLTSYSSNAIERNALNAFILNSISPLGTLTKAAINKIKDEYKK